MNDFIGAILPFVVLSIVPGLLINFYITSKFVHCAVVGRVANFLAAGGCGIDFEKVRDATLFHEVGKDAFSHGTTTDVAVADE